MTTAEALRVIRGYAQANRVKFSQHAFDESDDANAEEEDVVNALAKATSCRPGNQPGRWKVTGPDLDGDALDIVVVIEDGDVVITVM